MQSETVLLYVVINAVIITKKSELYLPEGAHNSEAVIYIQMLLSNDNFVPLFTLFSATEPASSSSTHRYSFMGKNSRNLSKYLYHELLQVNYFFLSFLQPLIKLPFLLAT